MLKIGKYLGHNCMLDEESLMSRVHRFVCIRVELNITEKLKPGCYITRENGEQLWIAFRYERLSEFCYRCGLLDHTEQACHIPSPEKQNTECVPSQFGPWMRVTHFHQSWKGKVNSGTPPTGKAGNKENADPRPTHTACKDDVSGEIALTSPALKNVHLATNLPLREVNTQPQSLPNFPFSRSNPITIPLSPLNAVGHHINETEAHYTPLGLKPNATPSEHNPFNPPSNIHSPPFINPYPTVDLLTPTQPSHPYPNHSLPEP